MEINPGQFEDFLEEHGMGKNAQHAATMRAAAVPVEDFEGEYDPIPGLTYNSRGANLLRMVARTRKDINSLEEKKDND